MNNQDLNLLFRALSQILSNQNEIKKHIGLNKFDSDYGYSETDTEKLSEECYSIARQYEEDEQEIMYEFTMDI